MARARRRCARPGGRQRALGRDATYLARGRAGDAARPALPSAAVVSPGILVVAARLCFPKIHIRDMGALASIGPFDAKARERRKVLGVQRGQGEMVCDSRGADEAIQYAHPMTQMEAPKPFQSRAGNLLSEVEEPVLAHFPGHRALLPSIAAACQSCKIRDH